MAVNTWLQVTSRPSKPHLLQQSKSYRFSILVFHTAENGPLQLQQLFLYAGVVTRVDGIIWNF